MDSILLVDLDFLALYVPGGNALFYFFLVRLCRYLHVALLWMRFDLRLFRSSNILPHFRCFPGAANNTWNFSSLQYDWGHYPGWGRAQNRLWSDHPRQVGTLIRPSQTEVTSDQTSARSKIVVRSKPPLIRRVPDRSDPWSDKFQTIVQTSSRPLSRLKCARNVVPDHMHVWSLQTFNNQSIAQLWQYIKQ